jgi:molybdate transport system ATP-binding protein
MLEISVSKKFYSDSGDLEFRPELKIAKGAFSVIFGRSGSGKTTLLRMIAGLAVPDSGKISYEGKLWTGDEELIVTPQGRNIGFVSQDFSLFPHMTVEENVLYASADADEAQRLIVSTGLDGLRGRRTDRLSGGQKQRVAFSRALAKKPDMLLLDEPMSALDNETKEVLRFELRAAVKRGITVIMVTHDIAEIFNLAERVFVIEAGKIAREGTPGEIFINRMTSNKFAFTGEIVSIEKADIMNIITVSSAEGATEVATTDEEASGLRRGDTVLVAAKAFQSILMKIK